MNKRDIVILGVFFLFVAGCQKKIKLFISDFSFVQFSWSASKNSTACQPIGNKSGGHFPIQWSEPFIYIPTCSQGIISAKINSGHLVLESSILWIQFKKQTSSLNLQWTDRSGKYSSKTILRSSFNLNKKHNILQFSGDSSGNLSILTQTNSFPQNKTIHPLHVFTLNRLSGNIKHIVLPGKHQQEEISNFEVDQNNNILLILKTFNSPQNTKHPHDFFQTTKSYRIMHYDHMGTVQFEIPNLQKILQLNSSKNTDFDVEQILLDIHTKNIWILLNEYRSKKRGAQYNIFQKKLYLISLTNGNNVQHAINFKDEDKHVSMMGTSINNNIFFQKLMMESQSNAIRTHKLIIFNMQKNTKKSLEFRIPKDIHDSWTWLHVDVHENIFGFSKNKPNTLIMHRYFQYQNP